MRLDVETTFQARRPPRHNEDAMSDSGNNLFEHFLTIKQASAQLGVHYWLLLRLVNSGCVPTYSFGNSKKRIRVSEVIAAVEAGRKAGV